jgi:beta-galactosidase
MNTLLRYGASMYPEVQSSRHWEAQLKALKSAGLNTLRLADSAWGNLEPAPGQLSFDWLRDYMDLAEAHGFEVILGTGSYLPPVWLSGGNDPVLIETLSGRIHPHSRKACCINAPVYRERVQKFLRAFVPAFNDHPALIGWQIDNEIDALVHHSCHCAHCQREWTQWLERKFGTPQTLNEALEARVWGLGITEFAQLPIPSPCQENTLPHALRLQFRMFERDRIFDFLRMQRQVIERAGGTGPFMHDWMMNGQNLPSFQNDPQNRSLFDVAGLNVYPRPRHPALVWERFWFLEDMARTHGGGSWLATETTTTACGSNVLDESPTPDQFLSWQLQTLAFGCTGILYWSGNRLRGGHWPYWGGLFDVTEAPEPELEGQVTELGRLLTGPLAECAAVPVDSRAVILMDYDQECATEVYPHTPDAKWLAAHAAQMVRRLGVGVEVRPQIDFEDPEVLASYDLIVLAGCPTFDSGLAVEALEAWVSAGGVLLVGPLVGVQNAHGVFREDGMGAHLQSLTGCVGRSVRKPQRSGQADAGLSISGLGGGETSSSLASSLTLHQDLEWTDGRRDALGLDGWCELVDLTGEAEVLARFTGSHPALQGRAAVLRRRQGEGQVLKLACWPEQPDPLFRLLPEALRHPLLAQPLPASIAGVPRTDGSLWVVNPLGQDHALTLSSPALDRISQRRVPADAALDPYGVQWLQACHKAHEEKKPAE